MGLRSEIKFQLLRSVILHEVLKNVLSNRGFQFCKIQQKPTILTAIKLLHLKKKYILTKSVSKT